MAYKNSSADGHTAAKKEQDTKVTGKDSAVPDQSSEMKSQPAASKPLQKMFSTVPPRYDLMNRVLTFRLDERWRRKAAREILRYRPARVMDLGTGTGDLVIRLAKMANDISLELTGLDYSPPMLDQARLKSLKKSPLPVRFICADASDMPFPDGYFDAIGTAFAFRNMSFHNPGTASYLAETYRILRPGGRFVIVETSQPGSCILRYIFHLYMLIFVDRIGSWLSGNRPAYHYLSHSAIHFHDPQKVAMLLKEAGFSGICHKPLLGGIAGLTIAVK